MAGTKISDATTTAPVTTDMIPFARVADAVARHTTVLALFDRAIVINESGADVDCRIEGNTEDHLLTVDAGADAVRLGDWDTNYANFAKDGEMTLVGTARVTKCLQFEAAYLGKGGTVPDEVDLGHYVGFSYDISDDSIVTLKLPCDWAAGTDLTIACRWYINEDYATNSGEINWQAGWAAVPADKSEALDSPTHSGTVSSGDQNIPTNAKTLDQTSVGTISGASLSANDEIGITFERIALVGGANPTADPVVTCLGISYTADKLGTAT